MKLEYAFYYYRSWKNVRFLEPLEKVRDDQIHAPSLQVISETEWRITALPMMKVLYPPCPVLTKVNIVYSAYCTLLFLNIIKQSFARKRNIARLLVIYSYFYGKCSNTLYSLVQTF